MRPLLLPILLATQALWAQSDHGFGAVKPVALPALTAHDHTGRPVSLRELLAGRRTALQFVFTDCPTTCPLLGSLFQRVQKALPPAETEPQLLTITVDPDRDTPDRLASWLSNFHAGPRWTALRLPHQRLNQLLASLGIQPGPAVAHSLQIFLLDASGRYIARTTAMPTAAEVVAALRSAPAPAREPGAQIYDSASHRHATIDGEPVAPLAARCSNCHGANRAGRSEGETRAPSLLPDALLTPLPRRGGPPSAYTQDTFCAALQTGRDPAGVQFSSVMPRYQIDPRACRHLWLFLTTPL
jgi:protein SCO1/2